jgi:hypothetical protein
VAESAGTPGRQPRPVPAIRRARGYRLYGFDGRRCLDLFQDGGRAVLGHRLTPAVAAMKAALSEGLDSCLPSLYEARFLKALSRAFPAFPAFRIFAGEARALAAASRFVGSPLTAGDVHDPALDEDQAAQPRVARWRPWLPAEASARAERAEVLLPVLPVATGEAPVAACFAAALPPGFPGCDPLPGFLLAGAVRGLEALAAGREDRCLEPVRKALEGSRSWKRVGVYVRPLFDPADYPGVHARFLEAGVLLAPAFPGPSILPAECSPGEAARLAGLFLEIPGG